MKKIISILLCFCMIFTAVSLTSITVNAAAVPSTLAYYNYTGGISEGGLDKIHGNKDDGFLPTYKAQGLTSKLMCSVDSYNNRKLEWSADPYTTPNGTDYVTVMTAGSKNPWGEAAWMTFEVSTRGYENITFSAYIGSTKKGPADYKLQYSLTGSKFTDLPGATYSIIKNKTLELGFNKTAMPADMANKDKVFIRIATASTRCLDNGVLTFPSTTGGEMAINMVTVAGDKIGGGVEVAPPTFDIANGTALFNDQSVTLSNPNLATAQMKYKIGSGREITYDGAFMPFGGMLTSAANISVTAWCEMNGQKSAEVTATYSFGGVTVSRYTFSDSPVNRNGAVPATGGFYEGISSLSASPNGDRFIPTYNYVMSTLAISPQDGIKWNNGGYWLFETSTIGFSNITFSAKALSTSKGPAMFNLQYSLDGKTYQTLEADKYLPLEYSYYFNKYALPSDAQNKEKVYIRLLLTRDQRVDTTGGALFNNEDKGNTFINDIVIAGTAPTHSMAYTTADEYYKLGEKITIINPKNDAVSYSITDKNGAEVASGAYTAPFEIPSEAGEEFTLKITTTASGNTTVFTKEMKLCPDEIAAFRITEENAATYISGNEISATSGSGKMTMSPNGVSSVVPKYELRYGIKASASADNMFVYNNRPGTVNGTGYWLVTLSTENYKNIMLSADTTSSEKGARDWAIAYSFDGTNYAILNNSEIRNTESSFGSYRFITLPESVSKNERVYLKIFISGSSSVGGDPLSDSAGSGHTGLNNLVIYGTYDEETTTPPILGDVDDNGVLNLADIVAMRNIIMSGVCTNREREAADCDKNGQINLADIVQLRNFIFAQ